MAGLFLIYIFQGLKFVVYDMPKEKLREAAKLAEVERIEEAFFNGLKTVGKEDECSQCNASVEGIDISQTKSSFRKADA